MWIESNCLPTCAKAGLSLQPRSSFAFSAVASRFPQLLKCDTNMVVSYHVAPYLQRCYASLITSNAVHDLKMLHKRCNTDVLGILLIYQHSLLGAGHPRDRVYISVKPLAAMLQPINVYIYVYTYACMYVRTYVRMYVCMYV